MQTFDAASLNAIALKLTAAAEAGDWAYLAQLDAILLRGVAQLHGQSLSSAPLIGAWQAVQKAHVCAMQLCQQAKLSAGVQLRSLQDTQAAQQAYAWQEALA